MNELIKINSVRISDEAVQTVNARDLHAFLEVGRDFTNWIKDRIDQYQFFVNQDFIIDSPKSANPKSSGRTFDSPNLENKKSSGRGGDRRSVDYHLTLDMAKELAMVERNEKGKQARQYFLECERRAKAQSEDIHAALGDPAKLRNVLLVYTEKVIALEAKVQEQAPKVEFHDAVAEAINCQSVQEVAKVLGTGPNRLFKFLRDAGLLMYNNLPYQQHIDAGHFRVVEKQYHDVRGESHTYTRTLVTGKGLGLIQKRLNSYLTAGASEMPQLVDATA